MVCSNRFEVLSEVDEGVEVDTTKDYDFDPRLRSPILDTQVDEDEVV